MKWRQEPLITLDDTSAERQHSGTDYAISDAHQLGILFAVCVVALAMFWLAWQLA